VEELSVDYVVIGSGPAGQKAAIQAAKLGKSVIVVEKESALGGASLNSGTIPSKSLRESILDLTDFYKRSFYGQEKECKKVSINDLNFRLNRILAEMRSAIVRQFEKNNIRTILGSARFENPHHLLVLDCSHQPIAQIRFSSCLIATGSKPRNPIYVPFDRKRVLDLQDFFRSIMSRQP
jgi:NAD(P) transhydrogenase